MRNLLLILLVGLLIVTANRVYAWDDATQLRQRVNGSDVIVLAHVIARSTSSVEVKVDGVLKGDEKITSLVFDYQVPRWQMDQRPAPEFAKKEQYLLFLKNAKDKLTLMHPFQGAQKIVDKRDPKEIEEYAEDPPGVRSPPIIKTELQDYYNVIHDLIVLQQPAEKTFKFAALMHLLQGKSELGHYNGLVELVWSDELFDLMDYSGVWENVVTLGQSKVEGIRGYVLGALNKLVRKKFYGGKLANLRPRIATYLRQVQANDPYHVVTEKDGKKETIYPNRNQASNILKALPDDEQGKIDD